jgi:murein peptide amidase A
MKPLGKNHGGYRGETIRIARTLSDISNAAARHGWSTETIAQAGGFDLFALRRKPAESAAARRIYISAGIHGDEPAGPLAMLRLLEQDDWPANAELILCPCLNPAGFADNRRENPGGIDLNRDYLRPQSAEVRAHVAWLEARPRFDLCLCLHEDWEARGFYVYELNPDSRPSLAECIVAAASRFCPVDESEIIEGRAARGGIIRPALDPLQRPQWPEAFWLLQNKTRLSYTMEAPSDFELSVRVDALVAAVNAAMDGSAGS